MKTIVSIWMALAAAGGISAQSAGWVAIPVNEYGALRAKAYPAEAEPARPPVEAALTRVEYDVRVNGEMAVGQANLTLDVFKDGWVRVPIPAGLLVREAKLSGGVVSLVPGVGAKGGGQLFAVVSRAGRATLALEIALPVNSAGGDASLLLPSSESGMVRGSVERADS